MRSILISAVAATAIAVPATALASHGADDGASTTASTTATTTATTPSTSTAPSTPAFSRRLTASQRAQAIAAARKVVPAAARVTKVEVERRSNGRRGYEVKLRTATTRYEVKLSRTFDVLDVDRHRTGGGSGAASGGSDDGRSHDAGDDHGGSTGASGGGSGSGRDHPEDD